MIYQVYPIFFQNVMYILTFKRNGYKFEGNNSERGMFTSLLYRDTLKGKNWLCLGAKPSFQGSIFL